MIRRPLTRTARTTQLTSYIEQSACHTTSRATPLPLLSLATHPHTGNALRRIPSAKISPAKRSLAPPKLIPRLPSLKPFARRPRQKSEGPRSNAHRALHGSIRTPLPSTLAIFMFLIVTLLALPSPSHAKDYSFPYVSIKADVHEDGSLTIVERRTYAFSGSFSWADLTILKTGATAITDFRLEEDGKPYRLDPSARGEPFTYELADFPDPCTSSGTTKLRTNKGLSPGRIALSVPSNASMMSLSSTGSLLARTGTSLSAPQKSSLSFPLARHVTKFVPLPMAHSMA